MSPAQIMSQIAEAKSYAFSCFASSVGDPTQAVAFHYMRGKITYVYYAKPGKEPVPVV
jgi:hypothetical protein